jgi:hypothetical protein
VSDAEIDRDVRQQSQRPPAMGEEPGWYAADHGQRDVCLCRSGH